MTPGRPVDRHSADGLTVRCFSTSIRMRGQFSELTETLGSGSGRLFEAVAEGTEETTAGPWATSAMCISGDPR